MKNFFAGVFGGKKEKVGPDKKHSQFSNSVCNYLLGCPTATLSKPAVGRIWVTVHGDVLRDVGSPGLER